MSLEELAEYVEGEKHLPNVPSSDDVSVNGVNISRFQMRLLEKIEEPPCIPSHRRNGESRDMTLSPPFPLLPPVKES